VARVVDAGAMHGAGGVEGAAWGAVEVVGPTRGGAKSAKQAMMKLCGAWRLDRMGTRSDHQPLYGGWSDRLGSHSDCQPLFQGGLTTWACCLTTSLCFGHSRTARTCGLTARCGKRWKARGTQGTSSGAGMGIVSRESSCRKMYKSLVR
jgi:hypothetical protein